MQRKGIWAGLALLVLALAVAYGARSVRRASAAQLCEVCRRPIHAQSRTVGFFGNRREVFCCPACALTAHRQSGRAVRLVELTDFDTGAKLSPDQAFVVRDSDVNLCAHQHVVLKHPSEEHFDRCSPSILAFAGKEAAARFIARHGGVLLRFRELAAAYAQ